MATFKKYLNTFLEYFLKFNAYRMTSSDVEGKEKLECDYTREAALKNTGVIISERRPSKTRVRSYQKGGPQKHGRDCTREAALKNSGAIIPERWSSSKTKIFIFQTLDKRLYAFELCGIPTPHASVNVFTAFSCHFVVNSYPCLFILLIIWTSAKT